MNKKKLTVLLGLSGLTVGVAAGGALLGFSADTLVGNAKSDSCNLVYDKEDAGTLADGYVQDKHTRLAVTNGAATESGLVTLSNGGTIATTGEAYAAHADGEWGSVANQINYIDVKLSGSVNLYVSYTSVDNLKLAGTYTASFKYTSYTTVAPRYFKLESVGGKTRIESITIDCVGTEYVLPEKPTSDLPKNGTYEGFTKDTIGDETIKASAAVSNKGETIKFKGARDDLYNLVEATYHVFDKSSYSKELTYITDIDDPKGSTIYVTYTLSSKSLEIYDSENHFEDSFTFDGNKVIACTGIDVKDADGKAVAAGSTLEVSANKEFTLSYASKNTDTTDAFKVKTTGTVKLVTDKDNVLTLSATEGKGTVVITCGKQTVTINVNATADSISVPSDFVRDQDYATISGEGGFDYLHVMITQDGHCNIYVDSIGGEPDDFIFNPEHLTIAPDGSTITFDDGTTNITFSLSGNSLEITSTNIVSGFGDNFVGGMEA